jgi:hypothetical protein
VAFKIPKPFLKALAESKKYTPADPKIREMMLKAGLGIDLKNPEKSALPGMGGLRSGRAFGKPPLEFGGPKPSSPPAKVRGRTLEQALASHKAIRDRPRIPTGITAERKAKGLPRKYKVSGGSGKTPDNASDSWYRAHDRAVQRGDYDRVSKLLAVKDKRAWNPKQEKSRHRS